jgi:hypothetical protein
LWGLSCFGLGYLPLDSQSCVSRNIVMTNKPFPICHFFKLFQQFFFVDVISYLYAVKPLSIIPVCIVFLQLLFISSSPENHTCEQHIIILDASFLRVSFSHISCSEFPFLTYSMPRMIVLDLKNSESYLKFWNML